MPDLATLKADIHRTLDAHPDQPWCVHRLYEEILPEVPRSDRVLQLIEGAADALAADGAARREAISATTIGVHCQDCLYWSSEAPQEHLAEFGPEYESPRILRRLASHFECHGL